MKPVKNGAGIYIYTQSAKTDKAPQITNAVCDDIKKICASAAVMKDKSGMVLLKLEPETPNDPIKLKKGLLAFADPRKVAVEFRHKLISNIHYIL